MENIKTGQIVGNSQGLWHVTHIAGRDVYGHSADYCDAAGCNGHEKYLGTADTLDGAEFSDGQPVMDDGDYHVAVQS